jgi:hypothetical protein
MVQVMKLSSKIDPDGHLRIDLITQLPEGQVDLVVVINPVNVSNFVNRYDFSDLVGKLTWQGDALSEQRRLRDEW